jgi:hypothetical protein
VASEWYWTRLRDGRKVRVRAGSPQQAQTYFQQAGYGMAADAEVLLLVGMSLATWAEAGGLTYDAAPTSAAEGAATSDAAQVDGLQGDAGVAALARRPDLRRRDRRRAPGRLVDRVTQPRMAPPKSPPGKRYGGGWPSYMGPRRGRPGMSPFAAFLWAALFTVAYVVALMAVRGLIIAKFWAWFVEPVFPQAPHLTPAPAMGLALVAGVLMPSASARYSDERGLAAALGQTFGTLALAFLIGWAFHALVLA